MVTSMTLCGAQKFKICHVLICLLPNLINAQITSPKPITREIPFSKTPLFYKESIVGMDNKHGRIMEGMNNHLTEAIRNTTVSSIEPTRIFSNPHKFGEVGTMESLPNNVRDKNSFSSKFNYNSKTLERQEDNNSKHKSTFRDSLFGTWLSSPNERQRKEVNSAEINHAVSSPMSYGKRRILTFDSDNDNSIRFRRQAVSPGISSVDIEFDNTSQTTSVQSVQINDQSINSSSTANTPDSFQSSTMNFSPSTNDFSLSTNLVVDVDADVTLVVPQIQAEASINASVEPIPEVISDDISVTDPYTPLVSVKTVTDEAQWTSPLEERTLNLYSTTLPSLDEITVETEGTSATDVIVPNSTITQLSVSTIYLSTASDDSLNTDKTSVIETSSTQSSVDQNEITTTTPIVHSEEVTLSLGSTLSSEKSSQGNTDEVTEQISSQSDEITTVSVSVSGKWYSSTGSFSEVISSISTNVIATSEDVPSITFTQTYSTSQATQDISTVKLETPTSTEEVSETTSSITDEIPLPHTSSLETFSTTSPSVFITDSVGGTSEFTPYTSYETSTASMGASEPHISFSSTETELTSRQTITTKSPATVELTRASTVDTIIPSIDVTTSAIATTSSKIDTTASKVGTTTTKIATTATSSPRPFCNSIRFQFTIEANYDIVVAPRKTAFDENLKSQLARIMRVPQICIQGLQTSKGSVEVVFDLVPTDQYGYLADENAMKAAAAELKRLIDSGELNISDLDGNKLVVIPIDPPTTPTPPKDNETTILILASVIGLLAVLVIMIAIAAFVFKRKSSQGHRLSPIEEAQRKLPSYMKIPFEEALFLRGLDTGTLSESMGKYCYNSGVWLGPGPEPRLNMSPEPLFYRPPTNNEVERTPRPPSAVRERLKSTWNLDWDEIVHSRCHTT